MTLMTDLDSSWLKIDEQPISLRQAVGYLQLFGRLRPFLQEIVSQHVIYQEIHGRDDLEITTAEREQAAIDFRLQQKLTEPEKFQKWLSREGMDYLTFQNRVVLGLKLKKLRSKIAEPNIEEYFSKHKHSLEQVELACLIVQEKELAQKYKDQILDAESSFEQISKESSLSDNATVIRGLVHRQKLPHELRDVIDGARIGELVGPQAIGNRWCLFQVEQFLPAVLEDAVKREIEERLFEEWLADKVNQLNIKFAVSE